MGVSINANSLCLSLACNPRREHARQHAATPNAHHRPDSEVTRILVMSEVRPLAEVKAKFSEMVDQVEHHHDRIVVTRNGRPQCS